MTRRFPEGPLDRDPPAMILLRSVVFNVLFYLNLVLHVLVASAAMVLTRHEILAVAKSWGRSSLWLLRVICGIDVSWQGLEKIPKGPLIVASKHQSIWETFALIALFDDPAIIVKREL